MVKQPRSALLKDLVREIWKTKSRFLSIFAIVAIGTAFFSGVKVSCYDMKNTAAEYFTTQNLFDFRVLTNYGIDENILQVLREMEGIAEVMPGYSADFFAQNESRSVVVRTYSYNPEYEGQQAMNRPLLLQGRMPENANECVVEQTHSTPKTFVVGGEITFFLGDEGDISDTLTHDTYEIVGVVRSPQYISVNRGVSAIGDGSVNSFVYLHESAYCAPAYTEAYIKIEGVQGLSPYENAYITQANVMERRLENIMASLAVTRHATIVEQAQQEIDDGERELLQAQRDIALAEQEIADGLAELAAAEKELQDGANALAQARAQADAAFAQALQELENSEQQVALLEAAYNAARDNLATQEAAIAAYEPLASAMRDYVNAPVGSPQEAAALAEVQTQASLAGLSAAQSAEIISGIQQYKATGTGLPSIGGVDLDAIVENILQAYLGGNGTLVDTARALLADLETQLNDAKAALAQGWAQYNSERATAYAALDAADAQLAQGWKTYYAEREKALAEIASGRREIAEGYAEIADARTELEQAKTTLAELAAGKGYTFDRDQDEGYASFGEDAERVDAIAAVFPVFFILVAALVCLTTMTRMVEDQRTQIGTMKALGYAAGSILVKYIVYAGVASFFGSIFGVAVGLQVLPRVIYSAYSMMYFLPDLVTPFLFPYFFWCTLVSVLTTCAAAYAACQQELRTQPAQLMRPKAPPSGKRVLLERIPFIWNRISFSNKVTVRNLMRYKKRVAITVVGIAGCTALMLTGFGLKDSISAVVGKQFEEVFLYEAITVLNEDSLDDAIQTARAQVNASAELQAVHWASSTAADFSNGEKTYSGQLVVFEQPQTMGEVIDLHTRIGKDEITIGPGEVVLSEKITTLLGLTVGDEITLTFTDETAYTFTISAISENYVFHFAYMSAETYERTFGAAPFYNMAYINFAPETSQEARFAYAERVLKNDAVLTTTFAADTNREFADMVQSLNAIVLVLIISAGALAFVVLYNLTNINVTERIREIATIKVLGFYDGEVAAYIYRENIACTALGIAMGLFLGIALHRFVVLTAEVDMVMFARAIAPQSYLFAALLTALFTVVVNVALYFKLRKVDMVLSLKSVE
ncbi:FtsX-like permease family protein [Ruminococcaceae bacterium OttesenSCG-928-N02]|nr:FtsX-like permease family protein [Ruminococcaceae bacterium OttesenSCG-928-N02]